MRDSGEVGNEKSPTSEGEARIWLIISFLRNLCYL